MIDLLLLAGVALCVLSVVMAIISVARTEAPRWAAVALVLGIVALIAGARLDDRPFGIESIAGSWSRLTAGQQAPASRTAPPAAATQAPAR